MLRRFFNEHPKHLLKLLGKKILTILRSKIVFILTIVLCVGVLCWILVILFYDFCDHARIQGDAGGPDTPPPWKPHSYRVS